MGKIKMSDMFKLPTSYTKDGTYYYLRTQEHNENRGAYSNAVCKIEGLIEKEVESICHAINNHDKLQAENDRLKEIYKNVRKYIDDKTYDDAEKIVHIDIIIDQAIGGSDGK